MPRHEVSLTAANHRVNRSFEITFSLLIRGCLPIEAICWALFPAETDAPTFERDWKFGKGIARPAPRAVTASARDSMAEIM